MDFSLVYWDTTLRAVGSTNRVWEKHQIRRHFSKQLEFLWKSDLALQWFDESGQIRDSLAKEHELLGTGYVPLVAERFELYCELDITFLRPGRPGVLVTSGGDLDNRIKVLLDALQIPKDVNQIDLKEGEENPTRIYCLLEDDRLVKSLKVDTHELLVPETSAASEVCLTIHVTVRGSGGFNTPYEFR